VAFGCPHPVFGPVPTGPYRKQPAMSAPDRTVSLKPNTLMRCKSASSGVRQQVSIILASDTHPVASSADSDYREPPSSTVWDCDLHDRFV
jgi:hypothetical protein